MNKTDVLKEIKKIFEKIEISDIESLLDLDGDTDDYFWAMATSLDDNEIRKVVYKSDNQLRVIRHGLILYLYIYRKNPEVKRPIWKLPKKKQQSGGRIKNA